MQAVAPTARAEARQGHSGAWAWATARETTPQLCSSRALTAWEPQTMAGGGTATPFSSVFDCSQDNIKCTILTIWFGGIKHFHTDMRPSPPSRTLSPCKTETLYPVKQQFPVSCLIAVLFSVFMNLTVLGTSCGLPQWR